MQRQRLRIFAPLGGFSAVACILLLFYSSFYTSQSYFKLASASPKNWPSDHGCEPFDRVAFIVVDALRNDLAKRMPFLQDEFTRGHGLFFTALADPPTVTLPRLKALTTGANPSFIDAVINIAEDSENPSFEHVDTWISQLLSQKKNMVFLGDDTWLRLFPKSWFSFTDGVGSFYVADFTTVDTNVTRHFDRLLSSDSTWDALILHYLGLDHIGHLSGPYGKNMPAKLLEMDAVVSNVSKSLKLRDTQDGKKSFVVVLGDHGMTDGGNHGGSSPLEKASALGFLFGSEIYTPQKRRSVSQLDIAPTLSALLGLGIPANSVGKVVEDVLDAAYPSHCGMTRFALENNRLQLLQLVRETARTSHGDFSDYSIADLQAALVSNGTPGSLNAPVILALAAAFGLVVLSFMASPITDRVSLLFILFILGGFFSTSFIEGESFTWSFLGNSFIVYLGACSIFQKRSNGYVLIGIAFLSRMMLSWKTLVMPMPFLNILATMVFLGVLAVCLMHAKKNDPLVYIVTAQLLAETLKRTPWLHPFALSDAVALFHYISSAIVLFICKYRRFGPQLHDTSHFVLLSSLTLLLLTVTRLENVPLLFMTSAIACLLYKVELEPSHASCVLWILSKIAFFAWGGSNSLATVDLSKAYLGLYNYNVVLVGILIFLSNYAGPILLRASHPKVSFALLDSLTLFTCMLATVAFRSHLFAWSVFSPAMLYTTAWSLLVTWGLDCAMI